MKSQTLAYAGFALLFTLLMSLPWLAPHMGWTALLGLLPLLLMERLATEYKVRHFWWWHYGCFVLWNAVTTRWVGGATVGGAIFAILANALQMSVVFGSFRWVKRRLGGVLPYLYLAAAWIAWERYYLTSAQISWPWLVLGNAFADTTSLVQWYSVLGTLGGSLWVWVINLSLFGLMVALSDGRMARWNGKARVAALAGTVLAFFGPMVWSACLRFQEEGPQLQVVIGQPNLDPYQKFESLTQAQQDQRFLSLMEKAQWPDAPVLVLAPETFTTPLYTDDVPGNETFQRLGQFLARHPQARLLFGASSYDRTLSHSAPNLCSYDLGERADGRHLWYTAHNSAVLMDPAGNYQLYHKSKLVVGVESTPYPQVFLPLERLLGGSLIGKDVPQKDITCLTMTVAEGDVREEVSPSLAENKADAPSGERSPRIVTIGTAICYESVYGEHCAGYVKKGAQLLTVITNDAWWGDTPGYRQHFNYSRLRAIETRRWVARCGNTGISALIDPCGKVLDRTPWWQEAVLQGQVHLLSGESFFVRYGDMTGRCCVFLFILLLAAALFRRRR